MLKLGKNKNKMFFFLIKQLKNDVFYYYNDELVQVFILDPFLLQKLPLKRKLFEI